MIANVASNREDEWANCPSVKGCWSQGKTREEALESIREAIALLLETEPSEHDVTAKR